MTKPFAWSWSKLKNFRTCPKRHYAIDISKEYKEADSEHLMWGNQVHEAMAKRIGKGAELPVTMRNYEKFAALIVKYRELGLAVMVEQKFAMDRQFQATGYFDNSTWFRAVADVLLLAPWKKTAVTVDWKTGGKIDPDYDQLAIGAQAIFANYPEIDRVETSYEWLGHDRNTGGAYTRDGMAPVWNKILPEVKVVENAHLTLTYPPKPSGLCKRYCPVTSCPYHGKGNR